MRIVDALFILLCLCFDIVSMIVLISAIIFSVHETIFFFEWLNVLAVITFTCLFYFAVLSLKDNIDSLKEGSEWYGQGR